MAVLHWPSLATVSLGDWKRSSLRECLALDACFLGTAHIFSGRLRVDVLDLSVV